MTHGYTSTLLLALYSLLMSYCVLPCMRSVLHGVGTNGPLGRCLNMGPNSTYSYNSIVVGFILTTNELLCLTLYEECIAWFGGKDGQMA